MQKKAIVAVAGALCLVVDILMVSRQNKKEICNESLQESVATQALIRPPEPVGESSLRVPARLSGLGAEAGLTPDAIWRIRQEMQRADQQYELDLGIVLPDKHRAITDPTELRKLAEQGDRFAATRFGQVLLEAGDVDGAIDAYAQAAELGSVAPLAEIAMLLEPGSNGSRDYVAQRFGAAPVPDPQRAYIAANVAYLRGYQDAYHVLDRIRRQVPTAKLAEYEGRASLEYMRLQELYRQRYGRYPEVRISAAEQMRLIQAFQADYVPRAVANPGGKP